MSQTQIDSTALLCQLLEMSKPEINGAALLGPGFEKVGRDLLHERLLGVGSILSHVTCPECGVELARVVRQIGRDQILLYCDECQELPAGIELQQIYRVNLSELIDRLARSLNLPLVSRKVIDVDVSWRLGVAEPTRAKAITWYFARHLHDPVVATHVRDQVRADQAMRSAKILTSAEVPLPDGSPLSDFSVLQLASVARLSQNRFVFFADRADSPPASVQGRAPPHTSLIDLRAHSVAYVDGIRYSLEPMQATILLVLLDDFDHRMEPSVIRDRCGSKADPFQPIRFFGRKPMVVLKEKWRTVSIWHTQNAFEINGLYVCRKGRFDGGTGAGVWGMNGWPVDSIDGASRCMTPLRVSGRMVAKDEYHRLADR